MDKPALLAHIIQRLNADLQQAVLAAEAAHADATHEESVAENQYDTLGLEASYLAAGHSRRVLELREALLRYNALSLRPHDTERGIQLTSLVSLEDEQGRRQQLFLGPEGAAGKLESEQGEVLLISPQAPLTRQLLGLQEGDELQVAGRTLTVVAYD
ncbi:transcription elongation factor GreAB [Pseudomonas sp. HAR-UPW-AIA-41]|uniref:transcription elongation factor GreAB n=1 Tax=Pseudomonas sp. HAR-UPW-AIA-41 TaxID=1985301 RepID=UPI000BB35BA5|nr:transcription elongation factor GreAB [Pseudomonas sp. HAR-UPW-AIA-41]PAV48454.1 transcription elongation factor GreAB [Pseudomonas sp. HAR-UPW-AIA-41]